MRRRTLLGGFALLAGCQAPLANRDTTETVPTATETPDDESTTELAARGAAAYTDGIQFGIESAWLVPKIAVWTFGERGVWLNPPDGGSFLVVGIACDDLTPDCGTPAPKRLPRADRWWVPKPDSANINRERPTRPGDPEGYYAIPTGDKLPAYTSSERSLTDIEYQAFPLHPDVKPAVHQGRWLDGTVPNASWYFERGD